jgi:hypothetical protein
MDQLPNQLESLIAKWLENFWLHHISVQVLSPNYKKLTTIFDEFSTEQAEFDAEHLMRNILF